MKKFQITLVEELPEKIQEKMEKGFIEHETNHGIDVNYHPFALLLLDEKEEVIGVLSAYTAFAEIYIDDIWIDKDYRGQGHGRQLILEMENHFQGQGYNNMNLVTSAFQAPDFYKKCGFEVEHVRENKKNPMLTKTFFIKYFDEDVQTQGLITIS